MSAYDLTPIKFKIPNTEIYIDIVMLPQFKKDKQGNWNELPPSPYMKVPQRLVWFNLEKPNWVIETNLLTSDGYVQANCVIKNPEGMVMRTAHKTVKISDAKSYDSAETGAIGRCLALLGYGTQYAVQDLEETDDEPVDAPTTLKQGVTNETKRDNQTTNGRHSSTSFTPNQTNYSSSGWSTKNMEFNKETAPTQSGNAKRVLVDTRANQQNTENVTYQALSEYVVKVGKHKGLCFAELEDTQIQQTKEYYKAEVLSKEKPPRPEVKELYEKAIMYLDVKKLKETMKGTLS